MKNFRFVWAVLLSLVCVSTSLAQVNYVNAPPLTEVVKTRVQPVQTGQETTAFILTWGGDIGTILANGNSTSTTPGSIFAGQGLKIKLVKEDNFTKQLDQYLAGKTPYVRCTMGMLNMASELLAQDPRTKPIVIYQLTWSAGGDALVVKDNIKTAADLRGKTIALQAYGPHVDYLAQILSDAGVPITDVNIKWTKDLTGSSQTPAEALRSDLSIDAAFVISPDALSLTSNGTVGTGAEQSVKGAKILLTTKTANRVIADVYAVRSDYFETHRDDVQKFVHGLLKAEETLRVLVKNQAQDKGSYDKVIASSAGILLDDPKATADTIGLYGDCEYVGYQGNVMFFANPTYPRGFSKLSAEIQSSLIALGLLGSTTELVAAGFDYEALKNGLTQTAEVSRPKFDTGAVSKVIGQRAEQGTLGEGELISFEILFAPNQTTFNSDIYQEQFDKVIDLMSTYGGAIITVEGHSDPLQYIEKRAKGETEVILNRVKQAAKNLSLNRANAVRDNIIGYAKDKGITLDPTQFAALGHGFMQPKTGLNRDQPIKPANEKEWRSNMRVVFRIVNVEAESSVFKP